MSTRSPFPEDALHADLTRRVIGGFHRVYNTLGAGLPEPICGRALLISLRSRGLSCATEVHVPVYFDGKPVGNFRIDIVVEGRILVELKARSRIEPINE